MLGSVTLISQPKGGQNVNKYESSKSCEEIPGFVKGIWNLVLFVTMHIGDLMYDVWITHTVYKEIECFKL